MSSDPAGPIPRFTGPRAGLDIIDQPGRDGNERTGARLRTVMAVSGSRASPSPLDGLVDDLMGRTREPLSLVRGPWPVPTGRAGIGDEALRELLADDWAGTRMSAAKLRKLIDTQLVSRHRELAADHPDGRDLGIVLDGAAIGRLLLDLDDDHAEPPAVVLVDIAIRPDRQRRGVGSRLITDLLAAAGEQGRAVRSTGVYGSGSLRWLLGLGLVDVGGDALYRRLVWPGP